MVFSVWSSVWDWVIRFYLKSKRNLHFIFYVSFLFVQIPFGCRVTNSSGSSFLISHPLVCILSVSVYCRLLFRVFLSPQSLRLLFFQVLSIRLLYIVLMGLFWAAINHDSVSLFRFSLRSHTQVISLAASLICLLKRPYSRFSSNSCFLNLIIPVFFCLYWRSFCF